jgi:hypothetical protein
MLRVLQKHKDHKERKDNKRKAVDDEKKYMAPRNKNPQGFGKTLYVARRGGNKLVTKPGRKSLQKASFDSYVGRMLKKHDGNVSHAQFDAKFLENNGKCYLLNVDLTTDGQWRMSMHNLNKENMDWNIGCKRLNTPQYDAVPCKMHAIDDIFKFALAGHVDTTALCAEMFVNLRSTPAQNGVMGQRMVDQDLYDNQMKTCHLPYIISASISGHVTHDKKSRRLTNTQVGASRAWLKDNKKRFYKNIVAKMCFGQKVKCAISGVPLSIENNHRRFSMDRIDNSQPHFGPQGELDNIRFVCRVFNTTRGWSRALFLEALLTQVRVHLNAEVRAATELELVTLRRTSGEPRVNGRL